jgi:hypothetical protein
MTVEDIDWGDIYKKTWYQKAKKFDKIVQPPPFSKNFDDNVHIAAEWIFRSGKTSIDITRKEPYLNLVKDHWYEKSPEGTYFHVCYPVDMMKFQHRYNHLFDEYMNLAKDKFVLQKALELQERMKDALWSEWKCTGWDGAMVWDTPEEEAVPSTPVFIVNTAPFDDSELKHVYENKCSRCQQPMPRALQMFNKLQYGKLKKLK